VDWLPRAALPLGAVPWATNRSSLQDSKILGEIVYLGLRFASTQAVIGRAFSPFEGGGEEGILKFEISEFESAAEKGHSNRNR